MNALVRSLAFESGRTTRISLFLSGNLLVDSRSDLRNVLPGRLPLEVSICHINKVNPSPNRKPFPPRPFGSSAENPARSLSGRKSCHAYPRKNSLELRIRGVKAEEKERTESTKRRIEYRPNRVEISSYGVTRARVYGVLSGKRERE